MAKVEQLMGVHDIALMFGVSEEYVRQVCYRQVNTCPHIDTAGRGKRKFFKLRPSWFERFLEEEAQRTGQAV